MSYIDGFVIAVPTANKQKYIEQPGWGTAFSPTWALYGSSNVGPTMYRREK